jgi:hypothetical protein
MNKLEYYIIKYLQECIRSNTKGIPLDIKYVELESQLISIIKGDGENEMYVSTECNLNNMGSELLTFIHITGNLYKIKWTDVFRFLIGEINESQVDSALLTKELKALQISKQPLTNFFPINLC